MAMSVAIDDIWFCQDCMIAAVNGDMPADADEERTNDIWAGLKVYGQHLVPDFNSESGDGHEDFAAHGCDCCRSPLHGEFWRFAVLAPV